MTRKIFVFDTNVILHDHLSINRFEDNDVVIPIEVIEELDHFKKGKSEINYNARHFLRNLDKLVGAGIFNGGISLGTKKGVLKISTSKFFSDEMKDSFSTDKIDHKILATALFFQAENEDRKVVLVSKDVNLRIKAKSLGILSEDYENDKIKNVEDIHKGISTIDDVDGKLISNLYQEDEGVPAQEFEPELNLSAKQFFILKNCQSSILAKYDRKSQMIRKVVKKTAIKIRPKNAEQTFAMDVLLDPNIELISLTGKAGTGKTLLALAAALEQRALYEQILLSRPIVPLSNREIGFLPGDEQQKVSPYMQPLFDNLTVIKHQFRKQAKEYKRIDAMLEEEKILITPLAFIRGRSLSKAFFIIDEAQNLTPHEVKTIITRAGIGTKIVFTGDINQIDSPYLDTESNGLSYLTEKMTGQSIFAHVNLIKGERSPLAELASDLL